MNEDKKQVALGLDKAAKAEMDGYHFYMMAARSTVDPKGRDTFERLAQEELAHYEFLEKQYKAIVETGSPDRTITLGSPIPLAGMSPIFSEKITERIRDAHYEMTALSIGIQLELSSQKYYEEQARSATDDMIKQFYEKLALWEAGHYEALVRQQDALKEDYWSSGGFSPY
jgi:rubrerythrin